MAQLVLDLSSGGREGQHMQREFIWGGRSLGDVKEAFAMAGEALAGRGDVV